MKKNEIELIRRVYNVVFSANDKQMKVAARYAKLAISKVSNFKSKRILYELYHKCRGGNNCEK